MSGVAEALQLKELSLRKSRGDSPINVSRHNDLVENAGRIRNEIIDSLGRDYDVYENGSFRRAKFERYLSKHDIRWPRFENGALDLREDTFKAIAARFPKLANLAALRRQLAQFQFSPLPIGDDGRSRCLLSPFCSKTGRNQPSSRDFAFGRAKWFRRLIRPQTGRSLVYVDYSQQEFGIAAALSGDQAMQEAYLGKDPYLTFAIQAGAAPPSATIDTHGRIRDAFKACALATLYGMGPKSLSLRIGASHLEAQTLLDAHRRLYQRYWTWSEGAVCYAALAGHIETVFGWRLLTTPTTTPQSIQNFPMQANGAEILRIACCYLTEAGIRVAAPVHDAVLIECDHNDTTAVARFVQNELARASRVVLGGFALRSDMDVVEHPQSINDRNGDEIWAIVDRVLSH